MTHKILIIQVIALFILGILFVNLFYNNFDTPWQHFSEQSSKFLVGQLDITENITHDLVLFNGKYYWPNGPFPAVYLMPFQMFFGDWFNQSYGQIVLLIVLFYLLYSLARVKRFHQVDSFFLAAVFFGGSLAIPLLIAPKSWYFSQVVCMTLLTGLLLEWVTKKRFLIIGTLLAAIFATRPTSGVIAILIGYTIVFSKDSLANKLKKIVLFGIPIALSGLLLLYFNYIRFGNILDNGYVTNDIGPVSEPLRQIGVFSLQHIPMNIYWYFLAGFTTVTDGSAHLVFPFISYSVWGLSFFLISPFFIYSFKTIFTKDTNLKLMWCVVAVTLVFLLAYFNTGWVTFGPRYAADLLPVLFFILLHSFSKSELSMWHRNFILMSIGLNLYLLYTTPII